MTKSQILPQDLLHLLVTQLRRANQRGIILSFSAYQKEDILWNSKPFSAMRIPSH